MRILSSLLAVVSTLIAVGAFAARSPGAQTIDVSEIKPGMKGYGLTVLRGTVPERFDVEVIGVLHDFKPDQDLILIRTPHPMLNHTSAVAGMSGSPVYIDGRLAGAYGYGWPFAKDPVAGVTPIRNMLAEMRRPARPDSFPGASPLGRRTGSVASLPTRSSALPSAGSFRTVVRKSAFSALEEHVSRLGLIAPGREAVRGMQLQPAGTPLLLGGFTDKVAELLSQKLEPFGLLPLQAGGGARKLGKHEPQTSGIRPSFVDGGAIGVQLIRGDLNANAIGTVTHVQGSKLVAFGHPMLNAGETGLPTATANVVHVLASMNRSFKIAEALAPVGTLVQDRQAAIVIDTQIEPATIPLSITLRGLPKGIRNQWRVEVASHRLLTPLLILSAISNAIEASSSDQADVMFDARAKVSVVGHSSIETLDSGYAPGGPNDTGALIRMRLFTALEAVYGNPFERARIQSIELELSLRFARDVTDIVDVGTPNDEVDPGSRVPLNVTLRPYGRAEYVKRIEVEVPKTVAGQDVELVVQAGDDVPLPEAEPRNLDDMLANIQNGMRSTTLVASVMLPSRGMKFRGHVVEGLPRSALDALQIVNESDRGSAFVSQHREASEIGRVLQGSARLRVTVRDKPRNK